MKELLTVDTLMGILFPIQDGIVLPDYIRGRRSSDACYDDASWLALALPSIAGAAESELE